jgi:limonene-1,2-epoxide hydrolase
MSRADCKEARMGSQNEAVVRSMLECLFVDIDTMIDHYSDDAIYHTVSWKQPVVGRDAIRAELEQLFRHMSDYRYTLRNLASTDAVVFIEVVDTFKYDGKDMTSHWSSVLEVNPSGKITAERDYYDMKEFETQLA